MYRTIEERTLQFANYILKTKSTVRATAKAYGISKSTVHNDIKKRLPKLNSRLYFEIQKIMDQNFEEKNIRGGLATKQKYQLVRKEKQKYAIG